MSLVSFRRCWAAWKRFVRKDRGCQSIFLKFWKYFRKDVIADSVTNWIFEKDNDLVVDKAFMIDFGVPNPVVALENGTQGWFLAGLQLEHGASRSYPGRNIPVICVFVLR